MARFLEAETGLVIFPAALDVWPFVPGIQIPGTPAQQNLLTVVHLGARQHGYA